MTRSWWKSRSVLITGGAGFIGSNLAGRLVQEGARVRIVDNLERGRLEYLEPYLSDIEFREDDLHNPQVSLDACNGVDVVIHLASKVGGIKYYKQRAGEVFAENTIIDHNVWSAALEKEVPFYFYASSAHVYPGDLQQSPDAPPIREEQAYPANPELSYGWAKMMGEKLILTRIEEGSGTRAAIARIIGSYGPNQSLDLSTGSAIPVFCRRAIEFPRNGPFVVLGTGAETRSYHFVSDTIDAILRSVEKLEHSKLVGPFNLGCEQRVTIRELAERVVAISGKKIEIEWDQSHETLIWGQALDCSYATQILNGWLPVVSLDEGLRLCYQHIEERLSGLRAGTTVSAVH